MSNKFKWKSYFPTLYVVVGPNLQSMACPASLFWAAKNRGNLALINLQGKAFQKQSKATVILEAAFNEGGVGGCHKKLIGGCWQT